MNQVEAVLDALGIEIKKKRGRRAWALCPFHNDHSPTNFFVRISGPRTGQNHCFSCKKGGSLVQLVMHVRGFDEDRAKKYVERLGKGYEPPRGRVRVVERPAVLGRARFKIPGEVMFKPLEDWPSVARSYAESRGITAEEVDRFGLGFAVEGRLGGRIVLPWRAAHGMIMGYSARSFVGDEPKYTTPHASENADLGTMFGEHTWTSHREAVVVTEGALNALAVLRAIDDYRVDIAALGGSAPSPLHAVKLSTFPAIILLTDPDHAGDRAAACISSMLGRHAEINRVRLPEKKDALDVGRPYLRNVLIDALSYLGVSPVVLAAS